MAPQPKPSRRGLGARLTAKAGPLPVWAWAAVILGAYLLYTRMHSATTGATPTPDTSGTSGADTVSSGQGTSADNLSQATFDSLSANTASLDALTSQLLSTPVGSGFGPTDPVPGDPSASAGPNWGGPASGSVTAPAPTAPPQTPAATGAAPAAHPTQTAAGKLSWFGQTFTTKAGFNAAAKAHGSSPAQEFRNHPQAQGIYNTLR